MKIAFTLQWLIDSIVSCFQSFLSLIWLHACAALLFSRKNWLICLICFLLVFLVVQAQTTAIPILCYHQVSPKARDTFEVSVDTFKEQLGFLKAKGYHPINTSQLLDILSGKAEPVGKPVVISFDDGYRSVYDYAVPVMNEFGFPGVVCVYPKFLDSSKGMTWTHLQKLASAGWSIESHSYSHPYLYKNHNSELAEEAFFEQEILRPKRVIESNVGVPVQVMVWPYGIYTQKTVAFARKCGYQGAFTVDGGGNYVGMDLFHLKRQVVYKKDNMEKFAIKLGMGSLEIMEPKPLPGEVVGSFSLLQCEIPRLKGQSPENFVLSPKITGVGKLDYKFDAATGKLIAKPFKKIASGHRFIDIYVRDKRTGITFQNGWFFTIRK